MHTINVQFTTVMEKLFLVLPIRSTGKHLKKLTAAVGKEEVVTVEKLLEWSNLLLKQVSLFCGFGIHYTNLFSLEAFQFAGFTLLGDSITHTPISLLKCLDFFWEGRDSGGLLQLF